MQKRTPDALEDRLSRPGPAEREHFAKLRALCLGAGLDENGNLVQLRGPLFLDFEASSLSSASWPIEVGISRLLEGRRIITQSKLIKPRPEWPEDDWNPESEKIHGIKLSELNAGEAADAVSQWLLNEAESSVLVSDAPEYDQKWLDRLLGHPGPQIACFDDILWSAFSEEGVVSPGRLHRAYKNMRYRKVTHRAGEDAANLCCAWRAAIGK